VTTSYDQLKEATHQQPLRLDRRNRTNEILRRKYKLIVQQPLALLLQHRARMQQHILIILHGYIRLPASLLLSNLHEEPGHQRAADVAVVVLILEGRAHELDLLRLHDALELHADVVGGLERAQGEEVVVAPLLGVCLRVGGFEGVVDVQHGEVVAVRVREEGFHVVGALAGGDGADEDLRNGEQGGEGEDLVGAVELGGGDQHDGEGGVEGEFGGELAEGGEVAFVVEAGEVVEFFEGAHQGFGRGRVHEVEVDEVVDAEFFEVEDRGGEVGAEYFRVRGLDEFFFERRFGVEAEAFPGASTAGSTGSLLCGGFGDGGDEEGFDSYAGVVDLLLAEARVHYVYDAVDCQ